MTPGEVSRRYRASLAAVTHELRRASQSALGRALPIIVAVVFAAGVAAGYLGITDAVMREPLATIAAAGALVVTYAVILGIMLWRVLGGSRGDVLDVIAWTARDARQEWTAASPRSTVPSSPMQARRWLATHPESDANRPQRVAAALMAGDLRGARETLERYPVAKAFERHQRAADGLGLDLVARGSSSCAEGWSTLSGRTIAWRVNPRLNSSQILACGELDRLPGPDSCRTLTVGELTTIRTTAHAHPRRWTPAILPLVLWA